MKNEKAIVIGSQGVPSAFCPGPLTKREAACAASSGVLPRSSADLLDVVDRLPRGAFEAAGTAVSAKSSRSSTPMIIITLCNRSVQTAARNPPISV